MRPADILLHIWHTRNIEGDIRQIQTIIFLLTFKFSMFVVNVRPHHSSCKAEPPSEAHLLPPGPAQEKIVSVVSFDSKNPHICQYALEKIVL